MFVNNIDPILLRLGIFEVRYYGLIFALGFIMSFLFLKYFIKKGKLDLDSKKLDDFIMYIILGVVIGARFFYFVFFDTSVFWTNPLEIFMVWHGGLSFHGGLIGSVIATIFFVKRHKINFLNLADASVVPAILGLALGRIANFTNQELYGTVSNLPWCVQFTAVDTLCRHPYQLYASLSHFIVFGLLLYIFFRQKKAGTTFWSFVFLYGAFRFITDFVRVDPKFLGISTGQILSLLMVIISLVVFWKRK